MSTKGEMCPGSGVKEIVNYVFVVPLNNNNKNWTYAAETIQLIVKTQVNLFSNISRKLFYTYLFLILHGATVISGTQRFSIF